MKLLLLTLLLAVCGLSAFAQVPKVEPGVSKDLAAWRAAHYSDVRYSLSLTLEKMSPVLRGTVEIRVTLTQPGLDLRPGKNETGNLRGLPGLTIILDWKKILGHEKESTISNVSVNGYPAAIATKTANKPDIEESIPQNATYYDVNEHLIFQEFVRPGENVIKLDFTSPILNSGSAVLRAVEKDGSEYIYSVFVPMNVSRAFPVFDQEILKARINLDVKTEPNWTVISNSERSVYKYECKAGEFCGVGYRFAETKPISIYDFYFKAGPKK